MDSRNELEDIFVNTLHEDWNTSYQETKNEINQNLQDINPTEKSSYFIGNFIDQLRYAVYLAEDIMNRSEFQTAIKDLTFGAITAIGGKFLLGNSNTHIIFQGINSAISIGLAKKHCNDITKAKVEAKKIISFLAEESDNNSSTSKYVPGKIINRLAIKFWREFRLHIELLSKGNGGSDILINYLTEQIINILMDSPESMVTQSFEDTLKHIHHTIYLGKLNFLNKMEIPSTKLKTGNTKLEWDLRGMLLFSPRIVCHALTQANSSKPMLEFKIYSSTATKYRDFSVVDADDSHKYPAVFIMNPTEMEKLSSFEQTGEKIILNLPSQAKKNITNIKINQELYVNFYLHAREVKRLANSNPSHDFISLMTYFESLAKEMLTRSKNLRKYSWLMTVVEIINVINLSEKYIFNLIKVNPYLIDRVKGHNFKKLYESCENLSNELKTYFHVNQEIYQSIINAIAYKERFFKEINKLPIINISKLINTPEATPYLSKPALPEILPIYVSPNNEEEARHHSCRINKNDETQLSEKYSYKNLEGVIINSPIMSKDDCNHYNEYLNNYFTYLEKNDFLEAYLALGKAIWYFSIGINDEIVFIQDDYGLVKRIAAICNALLNELDYIGNEIRTTVGDFKNLENYSESAGHLERYKQIEIFFRVSLKETTRLYEASKNIRDDKTLIEKFSDSSWKYQIGSIIGAGVVISGMVYFGSIAGHAISNKFNSEEKKENDSLIDKPIEKIINEPISKVTSSFIGISCAGVIVISANLYASTLENKRIIKAMIDPNSDLQRKVQNITGLHRVAMWEEKKDDNNNVREVALVKKEENSNKEENLALVPPTSCVLF